MDSYVLGGATSTFYSVHNLEILSVAFFSGAEPRHQLDAQVGADNEKLLWREVPRYLRERWQAVLLEDDG